MDNPKYRQRLEQDLENRTIGPAMETLLWFYAKGRPVERQEIGRPGEFSNLTKEERKARLLEEAAKL